MNNPQGRKPILNDKQAREIINNYVLKNGVSKEIRYVDLHNYCLELFRTNQLTKLPSESFWRKKDRMGRKLIDEVNTALYHTINRSDKKEELQFLLNLIENKITNNELKKLLLDEIKHKQNTIDQLEITLNKNEEKNLILKAENEKVKNLNQHQQELISQVFYNFFKTSNEENLLFFESAFKNIFSNPTDFLENLKTEDIVSKNNVSDVFKNRLKRVPTKEI